MPRPLVLGNGSLLVALDKHLSIRDFFYPYVGLYNHLSGHSIRVGIWVDGRFSWLTDPAWKLKLRYRNNTLVTSAQAENQDLNLSFILQDVVHHRLDVLLRQFTITNHQDFPCEVRLFQSHNFHIAETDIGDTAFYDPFNSSMIHYKRDNFFLISGTNGKEGIYQYATGVKGFNRAEGTWRDAEDGTLSMNPVAQGSVDSTVSFQLTIPARENAEIQSWICAGKSYKEVIELHKQVNERGLHSLVKETSNYWIAWSEKDIDRLTSLPSPIPEIFRRSLLTIRTNFDNHGAIIAANDSDIMETERAHYSYMWPRDGALVASVLDRLGYQDLTKRFFLFCKRVLPTDRAAFLHKYGPDGSWGATWHPWVIKGFHEIPIQEDSTALVLWSLWKHFQQYHDLEFMSSVYESMMIPCAEFLVQHRDKETGLPLSSYDLWEERHGIHAYTCGTVYGALIAAANLSDIFRDERGNTFRTAAEEVKQGIEKYFWDEPSQRFARQLIATDDGYHKDMTIDSALFALFAFGAFSPKDPRVVNTMRAILSALWVKTDIGGIARYQNDYYFRRSEDFQRVPGNPWLICTLWMAQWYIAQAEEKEELNTGLELLYWAANRALQSGILPEQLHPETGEPLSVAPLTWSHAEFIATTLDYLDKLELLGGNSPSSDGNRQQGGSR